MKKFFVFSLITVFMLFGLSQICLAIPTGSAKVKLVVVEPGLNVFVEKWGPSFTIQTNANSIFDNTTGNPYGFKIENIGTETYTIMMSITNSGGATLVTSGNPGNALSSSNEIRIAAVFSEWDTTLTVSDFGSEDVLSGSLISANTNTGVLHYPGFDWAIGTNVYPGDTTPVVFSIDMGIASMGTSYEMDFYVEVK